MRTITKTIEVYTFREANAELRDKIRDYINYNWDIYELSMEERIDTLKALANKIDATLDYSLSCTPDRAEFIDFKYFDETLLEEILECEESCPLTGVGYDDDLLDDIKKYKHLGLNTALLNASIDYIKSIHNEYESMLTDTNLEELCDINGYEFTIDGRLYVETK